ncbi:MAG TPA: 2,3-bisphosphoglycerate-dependent phosphoglycerate mutase [Methanothrix sp.]|nr:2,3-bisphosphoglycerate-dependent phosphoglycerate mutase [Methanothrix sp.]HOK57751.1 2,3-bisphosphoglycerate-dependent phosphoglycerate mutase [Methanothrix sp.]HOL43154.1 2,3-bisphosphoglycerate-dependent phosphoglycerate mutase [Methanothrix sp.]HPO88156.1 2,3-bisphosphoglycerate-dependent phosphoglycerate mutase [Methanothrix sp.]
MYKLVMLRHGQSSYNAERRFTGWSDPDLTPEGMMEARVAGRILRREGYTFDVAFVSMLRRAIKTLCAVLDEMDLLWIPVRKSWMLNERHYGELEGQVIDDVPDELKRYRHSFDIRPPALPDDDPRHPRFDRRYRDLGRHPAGESIRDVQERLLILWTHEIAPEILSGRRVIVTTHANVIRAFMNHMEGVPTEGLTVPTGRPIVYELGDRLEPLRRYCLQ